MQSWMTCSWNWASGAPASMSAKDSDRIKIPVFVDDLTIAATALWWITSRLNWGLKCETLVIQVHRDRPNRHIYLSQAKHIDDVLKKLNMSAALFRLLTSLWLSRKMTPDTPEEIADMSSTLMLTIPVVLLSSSGLAWLAGQVIDNPL